ncbi:peptidyl-prolyl cis-trans isomerase [Bacteroidia bacterium]|nr:peptidyl-prolyl cis-trans isomerase [Bacteroidia bacterium]
MKLYNETPQHRDNFVKLVNDGFYNGVLFHRVIADFMIQGGDPDSKTAKAGQQLGAGNIGYTVPAEFVFPKLYHKKGALAAARTGDAVNPQKASSGSQFYIVTGAVVDDAQLNQIEQSKQNGLGQSLFQKKVNENAALIQKMQSEGDQQGLQALQERFIQEIQQALAISPAFKFTPEQRETYKTIGGTPFLDNDYTVFGEVVEGMSVVDKISAVKTAPGDRPLEDVKVIKATVVK